MNKIADKREIIKFRNELLEFFQNSPSKKEILRIELMKIELIKNEFGNDGVSTGILYKEWKVEYNGKEDVISWSSENAWSSIYGFEPYNGNFDSEEMYDAPQK